MRSRLPPTWVPLAALALLSACGGGDGGSSGFAVSTHALSFSAEQGMGPNPGFVDLTVTNPRAFQVGAAYPAGQAPATWLSFSISPVDATRYRLDVAVIDTSMPVGSYTTTFLVGIVDADGAVLASERVTATLQVQTRRPFLDGSTLASYDFVEADGQPPAPRTFALRVAGTNPRTCDATVSVQDEGGWLQVSPAAATLGTSLTEFTVTARPGQPAGAHTGQVTVHCVIDGVDLSMTAPATFAVDEHRLVPSTVGLALVKTPTRSALTRQVRIADSLGRVAVPWTASADQAWLTVTPTGTAPGTLQLTADPAGLAAGTHLAWITLTSSDASVGPVERIRVGLTVLAAEPGSAFQAGYFGGMAVSPVEPVVFVVGANATDVTGYDLNTGAPVRTFTQAAASAIKLTVSGDGTLLYVWDSGARQVLELDASTGAQQRSFAVGDDWVYGPDRTSGLAWIRPAGRPELVVPSSAVYDLETGLRFGDTFIQTVQGGGLVATADGAGVVTASSTLYTFHRTTTPNLRSWASHTAGPDFYPTAGNACPSADGGHLYRTIGSLVQDWDVAAGALAADYTAAEIVTLRRSVCTGSGLLVTGGQSYPDGRDVLVFAPPSRTPIASLYSTGAVSSGYGGLNDLAVSADETRLVAFSTPQSGPAAGLYFSPLPARP
ncbi:MAG: hypothetical protein NDI82_13820 [Anaeromyxobacteraceae bacterium]|nr:hypothetical protein [Anaeromyxobacteraceae bacterium]